jgi:hypothetical protein
MKNPPASAPRPAGTMKCAFYFAAVLFVLLGLAGCAAPSGAVRNASPVLTGQPVSLDHIFVETSSSMAGLAAEKNLLNDSIITDLKETELFMTVGGSKTDAVSDNGIKVAADIRKIKKVSDNAREWAGALAGQARIVVHVTVSDLKTGGQIETFEVEGKSGKSAFAGTTEEAVERAAEQITAEVVRLNARTGQ